jgi:Fe-S cluster assembly protein SufD
MADRLRNATVTSHTVIRRRIEKTAAEAAAPALREADIRQLSERLGEPAWLAQRRQAAWETYQALPVPTTADKAWRRTDLRALALDRLAPGPAEESSVEPDWAKPLVPEGDGALLIVRPGRAEKRAGGVTLAERGVVFQEWNQAAREDGDQLREALGTVVPDAEGKFSALAAAAAETGVVLIVPPGVQLDSPLHSILWAPGSGRLFPTRVLIVLGQGASATVVHEAASPDAADGQACHVGIVEIVVGEGAQLKFVELQNWGRHVWNFTHEQARVERDGSMEWIIGAVGSRLTKNFSTLNLAGRGAQGRLSGFYCADGLQHFDHDTRQNHLAEHTTSDLLFKGALFGHSRSVWEGMIYVAPGAQKADGYQANRNLVLSKEARADSLPGLEILADDVRCSHGATVGQLEEEPIFYSMSRGIPYQDAARLIVDGFFEPVLQRIPFDGLRERFKLILDGKMG